MEIIWANAGDPLHGPLGDFASVRIYGRPGAFRDYTAMGVARDGNIIAAMIYYDYDRDAGVIQVSGAADTPEWLKRPVLREMFQFPFEEIGCQAVVMRVDPKDKRLRRILTAYGFDCHIIPRLRGRDKPEAIYVLGDDTWRANGFHKGNQ